MANYHDALRWAVTTMLLPGRGKETRHLGGCTFARPPTTLTCLPRWSSQQCQGQSTQHTHDICHTDHHQPYQSLEAGRQAAIHRYASGLHAHATRRVCVMITPNSE